MSRNDKPAAERRRLVEDLAEALYAGSDPVGVPWARRTRTVRDPWLLRAERQITGAMGPVPTAREPKRPQP